MSASQPNLPRDLITLAQDDLAAAKALQQAEGVSDASAGFHAQQAVEKALKAVLATEEAEFPFTHNIGLLMQLCEDQGHELPAAFSQAERLTPYAAAIRYGLGDPASVDPADALRWATAAIQWAETQLP